MRPVYFWTESLMFPNNFPAVSVENPDDLVDILGASDWVKFMNHDINVKNIELMGIACPTTASGEFYLQTNNASFFGRELYGIYYNSSLN